MCCTVLAGRLEPVSVDPKVLKTPGESDPETCLKPFLAVCPGSRKERECNVVVEETGRRTGQRGGTAFYTLKAR